MSIPTTTAHSGYNFRRFYHLARQLYDSVEARVPGAPVCNETLCRNIVSRGYYAVFHAAQAQVSKDAGFSASQGADAHGAVVRYLKLRGGRWRVAAGRLSDLRELRNRADYNSDLRWWEAAIDAHMREIESLLNQFGGDDLGNPT